MADKIAIVTDSTADVPIEDQDALNIEVIPAVVTLDGESYNDGMDISRSDFYRRLPQLLQPPTTGAPSIMAFENTYERLLQSGIDKILSIHLPPSLSGMLSAATQAAKSFGDRVKTFDSGQVSLGMGFQAIEAASAVIRGETFGNVLAITQQAKENIRLIALIDTLEFLKRSGRISWLTAGLGNLLRIKIILELFDGVVNRIGQVRTRGKAILQLKGIAETWGKLERLAIPYSADSEDAITFADQLKELCIRPPIIIEVTTAIGAHIGPGALGVIGLKQAL
jgi:DegV family protein with EDD domain